MTIDDEIKRALSLGLDVDQASEAQNQLAKVDREVKAALSGSLAGIVSAAAQFRNQVDDLFRQNHVIEAIRRMNQRFNESMSMASPHLMGILSAADLHRKQFEDVLRQSHVLETVEQMNRQISHAFAGAVSSAEFHKFDGLLRSISVSADLYLSKHSKELAQIAAGAAGLIEAFQPAALAYEQWRASDEVMGLAEISPAVPAREQFLSTDVVVALQERALFGEVIAAREVVVAEVEDQLLLTLPPALSNIDAGLYRMWRGAWEAFGSSNPDRVRHSITSLRELLTHVLHALASDEDVRAWSSDPKHYHDDRPTRRARFLFVLTRIDGEHLRKYLEKEAESCSALMESFQPGTHEVTPPFSDIQLKIMLRKVHSIICTLLEIWQSKK